MEPKPEVLNRALWSLSACYVVLRLNLLMAVVRLDSKNPRWGETLRRRVLTLRENDHRR